MHTQHTRSHTHLLPTARAVLRSVYQAFLGTPLKLWASIGHWWIEHFDLDKYTEVQKPRVIVSLAAVFAFMAVGFPLIVYYTGWAGFAKFWLMPWLGYHFWMSECAAAWRAAGSCAPPARARALPRA